MSNSIEPVEIATREGPVRGVVEGGLAIFRGVPFAESPTGALRFKPPVPPPLRSSVLDATRRAPICPQIPSRVQVAMGPLLAAQSEECLTATVWAPLPLNRPHPTLVWVHGGVLASGGGAIPWYDGARLARENDIVVVSPNYRLGALGFLYHPPLVTGNMGQKDIERAVQWISANAAAFGGDPSQMTLMGQSAGGMAISIMLARPELRALFRRAIFLSGSLVSWPRTHAPAEAMAAVGTQFCQSLGVEPHAADALDRLQCIPVARILEAQLAVTQAMARTRSAGDLMPAFTWTAAPDTLTGAGLAAAIKTGVRGLEILLGSTNEEARLHQGLDPRLADLTAEQLPKVAEGLFGAEWRERIDRARRARPGAAPPQLVTDAYTELFNVIFSEMAWAAADAGAPTWAFRMDWGDPRTNYGACHCIDLPFLFGTFEAFKDAAMIGAPTEAMHALSRAMRATIGRFAKSGSPEGPDVPTWPRFTRQRPTLMTFNSVLRQGVLELEPK